MTTIFDNGCLVNSSNTFFISLKHEELVLSGNGSKNFDKDIAFLALCSLDSSMALLSSPDDAIGSNAIFIKAR